MNQREPFQPADLEELGRFLDRAEAVVAMEDIADAVRFSEPPDNLTATTASARAEVPKGQTSSLALSSSAVIGMRHDVDNEIASAVQMAEWEHQRGYRSTYFILHTAPYWQQKETLKAALEVIADCGHEIGFHLNAITEAIETGEDPLDITQDAVDELRGYGYPVRGVVAHGDQACYEHHFINDELFTESRRSGYGPADRVVGGVPLRPVSRAELGFDYDPNWLSRGMYVSDSGGRWSREWSDVVGRFPLAGQLHMLVHPCWWSEAFSFDGAVV